MEQNSPLISPQRDIAVFQSLTEIPFITFPTRLDRMLMVVCTAGSISATIDVETRIVHQNDILVLRPGHLISGCKVAEDFAGFFITVTQEKLNQLLPSMRYVVPYSLRFVSNPIINVTEEEIESLKLIYDLFCRHLSNPSRPYQSMALGSLCEVLFYNTLGIYSTRVKKSVHKSRREEL
ncbi:MAG: hypothetical protein K2G98_07665, partial [Duncaniella sp.]|nr:hypothetical protein [Duncaniella sp.]